MSSCLSEKTVGSLLAHSWWMSQWLMDMDVPLNVQTGIFLTQSVFHRYSSVWRVPIRYYRQIYTDRSDPIIFVSVTVNTSGHIYEDFTRLFFLHVHRESSILTGELPEESDQFRFLWRTGLVLSRFSFNQILDNVGYYSHQFVYVSIHVSTSFF
jgi:hypothetical protein